jgi:hypothetical protein
MRAMLFLSVFVGMLWTVDTYSLQGRVTQASKEHAAASRSSTGGSDPYRVTSTLETHGHCPACR